MTPDEWLTTAQAGEILGMRPVNVARLCQRGALSGARKIGRDWLIPRESVEQYRDHRPRPGRKPKSE